MLNWVEPPIEPTETIMNRTVLLLLIATMMTTSLGRQLAAADPTIVPQGAELEALWEEIFSELTLLTSVGVKRGRRTVSEDLGAFRADTAGVGETRSGLDGA